MMPWPLAKVCKTSARYVRGALLSVARYPTAGAKVERRNETARGVNIF